MTLDGEISADDPRAPDVRALLERHLTAMLAATPPEHAFALDVDGLLDPAVSFFSFRAGGELLGVGAIKRLDAEHGEIKSMHTAAAARGLGVGRAMLHHLLGVARAEGLRRVSLETGTMAEFAPARALYESAGFTACGPFADYRPSDDNCFMTLPCAEPLDGGPQRQATVGHPQFDPVVRWVQDGADGVAAATGGVITRC